MQVLHVDDEADQLRFAKLFLEEVDPDIHVVSVQHPEEALRLLSSEAFDCVVADYVLTGMDGLELCRRIRERSQVPFILYTACGSEEVASQAFAAGVDDYIRKEVDPNHFQLLAKRIRATVERRRLEEALRERERELSWLVENAPDAIFRFELGRGVTHFNQAFLELFGYTPEEVEDLGSRILELIHPENREKLMEDSKALLNKEPPKMTGIYRWRNKLGETIWVKMSFIPLVDGGEFRGFEAIVRDVTERKRLEEALRSVEARYRRIVELAPDPIITLDMEGVVTSINAAGLRQTGYSEEEVVGRHFSELSNIREKDIPKYTKLFNSAARGEVPEPVEILYYKKDGTPIWSEVHAVLLEEDPETTGVLLILRDVTRRRLPENELRRRVKSLEETLNERTRSLLVAERLVAAGRVASTLAHDLRSPLQTIKNAVYLLRWGRTESVAEIIESAVDRAVWMLDEIRARTGEEPLRVEETDLAALIRRAVEEVSVPDSVEVELRLGDGLDAVPLDPSKIRRVLDNLIRNAVESMPQGGRLTVAAERREGRVRVEVSDTGVGIPEELKPRLFEPFQTNKRGGMGLGLAFCRRAVEAHGGSITFDSTPGKGTTFTVTLPFKRVGGAEMDGER